MSASSNPEHGGLPLPGRERKPAGSPDAGGSGPDGESGAGHAGPRRFFSVPRLWVGGVWAGCMAVVIVLAAVLLLRNFFAVPFLMTGTQANTEGDADIGMITAGVFGAAVVATLVLHVLLLVAPRPERVFALLLSLATLAMVVAALVTDAPPSVRIVTALVYLFIGVVLGFLFNHLRRAVTAPM